MFVSLAVIIGFMPSEYSQLESQSPVEVNVTLIDGVIDRIIGLIFDTVVGTADG